MDTEKLRTEIDQLRSVMKAVDAGVATGDPSPEALPGFGLAVDNLRKNLWAGLTAKYSADYDAFLGTTTPSSANSASVERPRSARTSCTVSLTVRSTVIRQDSTGSDRPSKRHWTA